MAGEVYDCGPKNSIAANIGLVTSTAFCDINKDGWQDLVVAGEWMPVTLFLNDKGVFEKGKAITPSGLWQTLTISDINGDGKVDILAGNWGLNSKLKESDKAPLKLYVKDFDSNGSVDQLLTYTADNKEYTFLRQRGTGKATAADSQKLFIVQQFCRQNGTGSIW